jgi:fumarate reductase subunit C
VAVYCREFAAETLVIFGVQVVMGIIAQKSTHSMLDGFIVISLYPLSIVAVALMEKWGLN